MLPSMFRAVMIWVLIILHIPRTYARAGHVSTIPIKNNGAVDDFAWIGNFTVGATQNQPLAITVQTFPITLFPSQYNPSPKSKKLHPIKYRVITNGTLTHVTYDQYADVLGIPELSLPDADFQISRLPMPTNGPSKFKYGVLGLGTNVSADSTIPSNFAALCKAGLAQCRFGVSLETGKTGRLIFGKDDKSIYKGSLVTSRVAFKGQGGWVTYADFATKDEVYRTNALISFNLLRRGVIGPSQLVQKIFKDQGVKVILKPNKLADTPLVYGEFPCEKPPILGFSFGEKIVYINPSATIGKRINNNQCQSVLIGNDEFSGYPGGFSIGSSFFEGHYLDFNIDSQNIGIADLKDRSEDSSTGTGSSSGGTALASVVVSGVAGIITFFGFWICYMRNE